MNRSHKIAGAVALSLGLALAAGAHAHQGQMGGGMGQGMHGGDGMHAGMQHGMHGGSHAGRGHEGRGAQNQLMTPEERTAFREKMNSAKTPEERRQIAQANHAEMQKRAQEKGITLHEHRGPRFGNTPEAPATTR